MKELKLIARNFAPHFLAISLLLAFIASRCGLASFCAYSYVIAPECSHILIVLISSVCFIISSFISAFSYALDFKGIACIFQGKTLFFVVFRRSLTEYVGNNFKRKDASLPSIAQFPKQPG